MLSHRLQLCIFLGGWGSMFHVLDPLMYQKEAWTINNNIPFCSLLYSRIKICRKYPVEMIKAPELGKAVTRRAQVPKVVVFQSPRTKPSMDCGT